MAVAAVKASLRDLEKVRQAGIRLGTRSASLAQRAAAIRTASKRSPSSVRSQPLRTPRGQILKEKCPDVPCRCDEFAPDWRWGHLGDVAYRAVDDTVKIRICRELTDMAGDTPTACPLAQAISSNCGIRDAITSYAQVLHKDGIKALEKAVGNQRAEPRRGGDRSRPSDLVDTLCRVDMPPRR